MVVQVGRGLVLEVLPQGELRLDVGHPCLGEQRRVTAPLRLRVVVERVAEQVSLGRTMWI